MHNQLSSLLYCLTSTVLVATIAVTENKLDIRSAASYMEMKDIFQELGADDVFEETDNFKTKANQNLFYHPPYQPNSHYGRPQNFGSYFQPQQQRPLQQYQYQHHRPQYNSPLPKPQTQNIVQENANIANTIPDSNKTENSEKEKEEEETEKVDAIALHFDYSDMDTIEGGIDDGQDFEIMEMVE